MKLFAILLILSVFAGGASAAITYDAGANTITITGYSEASPCTFNDLYNADVAGGWNRITKCGDNVYHIDRLSINFGDGITNTWFGDSNKIVINKGWAGRYWYIKNNTVFRLGVLDNRGLKTTRDGCVISTYLTGSFFYKRLRYYIEPNAKVLLYDSKFISGKEMTFCGLPPDSKIYGSCFGNHVCMEGSQGDYYGVNFVGNKTIDSAWMALNVKGGTFEDVYISGRQRGMLFEASTPTTVTNIKIRDCITSIYVATTSDIYIVDSDIDVWNFLWSYSAHVKRQYTLNLQTAPNAKITIMDHADIVYRGCAHDNGTIDEQILTMGYYTQATGDTLNSQNPYSIEIKKVGYHTYRQKFTLEEPLRWHINLVPDCVLVGSDIIRPARRT